MKFRSILALYLITLAAGCSEVIEPDPQDCFGDTKKCSDDRASLIACVNGKWSTIQECQSGTTCDYTTLSCKNTAPDPCADGSCTSKCTENMLACDPNANQLLICKSGNFVTQKMCNADEWCNPAINDCAKRTPDAECEANEFKCEQNSLYACQDGKWKLSKTCAPQTQCNKQTAECDRLPECSGDEKKCDENLSRVLKCQNGFWSVDEQCAQDSECDPTQHTCKKGCTEGDSKCDLIANALMKCTGGTWQKAQDCAEQICNADSKRCEDKPECTGSALQCNNDNTAVMTCINGKLSKTEDCKNSRCIAGECVSSCTEGASECRQGNAVTCTGGTEIVEQCSPTQDCIVRQNKASCEDHVCNTGDFECTTNGNKRVCQDNQWSEAPCQTGFQCSEASKGCIETICQENTKRCNQNNVESCKNNAWSIATQCKSTEMCDNNRCIPIVCTNGDKRCGSSTAVEKCESNNYIPDTQCKSDEVCIESGKTASCVKHICDTNQFQCTTGNVLQRCENNNWITSAPCSNNQVCDEANKKCAERICKEGETKCSSTSKSVLVCSNNAWKTSETCSTKGELCYTTTGSAACAPKVCDTGTTCTGNVLKVCENNKYTVTRECLQSETCDEATKSCVPKPQCATNEYKCEGNVLYTCSALNKWQARTTCVGNEICDKNQKKCVDTSVCQSDQYYCDEQNLMKCGTNGQWLLDKKCSDTEECNATAKACKLKPVCESGEYNCNGLTLQKCVNGQWAVDKTCTQAQTCSKDLKKCLSCTPGEYECNALTLKYCNAGTWETKATCRSTQICSEEEEKCIDCTGDGYDCNGQVLRQCQNNAWVTKASCSSTEYCDASQQKCISKSVCENGKYSCDGQKLMQCVSGQWKLSQTCSALHTCDATAKDCKLKPVCTPTKTKCSDNTLQTCDANGQWTNKDCATENAICVTSGSTASCVKTMTLPTWCNIQSIKEDEDRGYGRVLMPNQVQIEDIEAHFVCGSVSDPVMSWTYQADAVYNRGCSDCFDNTEFMSYSLSAPAGNYQCTYRFDFGPQSFACLPKFSNTENGGSPIMLDASTKMTTAQTLPITVDAKPDTAPTWCHFNGFDTEETKVAYGRLLLPVGMTPGMIKAKLICGDVNKSISTWSISRNAKQNLFCSNEDCGYNVEFMSEPFVDAEHPVANGTYGCAFQFDVAGKSYVCPTDISKGNQLIELTSGKMLNAMDQINVEGDPISVWSITVQ